MYYLRDIQAEHRRMRNAIIAAFVIHLVVVCAVSFNSHGSTGAQRQIEVTLTTSRSDTAPKEARHIAQSNQQGSGDEALRDAVTARETDLPLDSPAQPQAAPPQAEQPQSASGELLSTVAAAERAVTPREQRDKANPAQGLSPDATQREQRLAALQAEPDLQDRSESSQPRVRRITSVSAAQSADAAYLLDWRRRLEAVGNRYYPEASVRYGMYGDLRLLVVIRKDGELEDVRVLESSGYAVLDEAAIKIVRMAAPYSPFPPDLAATTDELEIVRTWQFRDHGAGEE